MNAQIIDHASSPSRASPMRETAQAQCPLCGQTGDRLHERMPDRLFAVPGQWSIRKCGNRDCGLLWLDPKPIKDDIHKAYAAYYTHQEGAATRGTPSHDSLLQRFVRFVGKAWLSILFLGRAREAIDHMYLDELSPGRVLEVGCGGGLLLERLKALGWEVEGQDVDPNAGAARREGMTVHLGELAGLGLSPDSYDAIVMNHVIEHADDPVALLRDCRALLKRGGVLVAATPNSESFGHRRFGASWLGLDAPRHLNIFNRSALGRAAADAGFSQQDVSTTAARAGVNLAASREIETSGRHRMGRMSLAQAASAFWYQLIARLAFVRSSDSGEELVLRAWK